MTDSLESLVIEHLRHIRRRVDQTSEDIQDLKLRMSSLEAAMLSVKREVHQSDETDARQQVSIDRLVERIERIERRLDLLP
jgi:chromosome segregation ATPase